MNQRPNWPSLVPGSLHHEAHQASSLSPTDQMDYESRTSTLGKQLEVMLRRGAKFRRVSPGPLVRAIVTVFCNFGPISNQQYVANAWAAEHQVLRRECPIHGMSDFAASTMVPLDLGAFLPRGQRSFAILRIRKVLRSHGNGCDPASQI